MLIFTYGTLMKGYWNHHVMKEAQGKFIGRGKIRNKEMYYAYRGSFPVVIEGVGDVYGEVYEIEDRVIVAGGFYGNYKTKPLKILDKLEGYRPKDPKSSMYIRKRALCTLENGNEVWVSFYYWNGEVNPELRIPSGKYPKNP